VRGCGRDDWEDLEDLTAHFACQVVTVAEQIAGAIRTMNPRVFLRGELMLAA
jgi:hypothetical protein